MNEDFFYYLWKFRLLDHELNTDSGESITILHPGEHNHDSGPDFFNAKIRIGSTLWAGNVEIHVQASDWYRHNHQQDRAFDNVILHVVYENDVPVTDNNGKLLPTLTLKDKFHASILERYKDFQRNHRWIPCEQLISRMDQFPFRQWAASLALELQAGKMKRFHDSLEKCGYDWEECFYQQLARSFGFRINSLPFELLAKSIPIRVLRKYTPVHFQLEALLFGQAGFLFKSFSEEYPEQLSKEYKFLSQKHSLEPVNPGIWKFLRLRPSNFPTLRIAEYAALLHRQEDLFSVILECENVDLIRKYFTVRSSDYWSTHFLFGKISADKPKFLGAASIDLLIFNFVVPFLFFYGDVKKMHVQKEKGIFFLEQMQGETNADIRKWKQLGLPVANALQTQALIQLKRAYCDPKMCLNCRIGNILLNDNCR
jgi:hypothetical protein